MSDLSRSDHAPFWLAGIPAVSLTDTADFRSPHYHRGTDRSATLDVHFAARSARLAAATVLLLAELEQDGRCVDRG
jgi:Zn-dependent M28 family amino/carboxypeptidase